MEFWSLLTVASMPVLKFLLVGLVGAFLASTKLNILSTDARREVNKIAFVVFFPALSFANLANTVNLDELISWWFMPINIGITFLVGGSLGWATAKILKLEPQLENLIIACCSAGNLGPLILIIIPAICSEKGNPFGEANTCSALGLSYASLSMALGNIYIWTHTYSLLKKSKDQNTRILQVSGSSEITESKPDAERGDTVIYASSKDAYDYQVPLIQSSHQTAGEAKVMPQSYIKFGQRMVIALGRMREGVLENLKDILSPPTVASIGGLIVGVIPWLKTLIIGEAAPLRVVQDSVALLGDGAIPCTILVLGGNLTQGLRTSAIKPSAILAVICVRYLMLPFIGIGIVRCAEHLGFLPPSPLFSYVLLLQFAVPPGVSIGTITQLFEVSREECSVIFFWTYLVSSFSLTIWSMVFMWILS